jgi:hypothetical protein
MVGQKTGTGYSLQNIHNLSLEVLKKQIYSSKPNIVKIHVQQFFLVLANDESFCKTCKVTGHETGPADKILL